MSVLWSVPLTTPRFILLGKLKLSYVKITEKATSLKKKKKKWLLQWRSFSELFDFDWFGSCGPWIQNALQTLGIILLKITTVVSLMHYILLNACLQLLTTKQTISVRLGHQKGMKRVTDLNVSLKSWPVSTTENQQKNVMTCEYHRAKNCKNLSSSWEWC